MLITVKAGTVKTLSKQSRSQTSGWVVIGSQASRAREAGGGGSSTGACRAHSLVVHLLRTRGRRLLGAQRLEVSVDELSGAVSGGQRLPDDPRLAQETLISHQQVQQVLETDPNVSAPGQLWKTVTGNVEWRSAADSHSEWVVRGRQLL